MLVWGIVTYKVCIKKIRTLTDTYFIFLNRDRKIQIFALNKPEKATPCRKEDKFCAFIANMRTVGNHGYTENSLSTNTGT